MAMDYARSFYSSKQWKKTNAAFMSSKNYTCERCRGVARIVHHKIHINPSNITDFNITLNWDNLEALCQNCHNAEHGGGNAYIDGVSFDDSGNMVYTPHK